VHLYGLRQKLNDDPANPRYITVEKGVGVRFAAVTPVLPTTSASPPSPHLLPAQWNQFVGREQLLAQVSATLREPDVRLITLLGPAGAGKTRLAIAAAEAVTGRFPDGVVFVPLASLDDPALIVPTIAEVLRLSPVAHESLEKTLASYLAPRTMLLVLDNCEHLLEVVDVVATILTAARQVKILATSRALLALYAEHQIDVPPLRLPAEREQDWRAIREVEAVQLFVQRARAVRAGFRISEENAGTVATSCRQLDGLPLAIELAAAKLASMTPKTLLVRLVRRMDVLRHELRHREARQSTLYDAIDWSFRLLKPLQQALFTQLAIFVGGWTVQAAASVGRLDDADADTIADELALLAHQSLIQRTIVGDDELRYTMLETIREYARERLREMAAFPMLQQQHAAYYHALAEQASAGLVGPDEVEWLERLERDHDNLRAALRWSMLNDPERGAQLSGTLWRFWWIRGSYAEAQRWLLQAANHAGAISPAARSQAFNAAGVMAQWQGNTLEAKLLCTEALAIRRALGDPAKIADTLTNLAFVAQDMNDYATAAGYLEENLALYRRLGEMAAVADTLTNLGGLWDDSGNHERAQEILREARVVWEAIQDRSGLAATLVNLGKAARNEGHLDQARPLIDQGLAIHHQVDDTAGIANGLLNLGIVATMQGQVAEARGLLEDALTRVADLGERVSTMEVLEAIAALLHRHGEHADAAQIVFAVTVLRERESRMRTVPDTRRYARLQEVLNDELGERGQALVRENRHRTLEQLVGVARTALLAARD
jgi:predicted ATPase